MSKNSNHLCTQLESAFEQGHAAAMDPTNISALEQHGSATTNLNSYWLHQHCPVCKHTFRLGDEVQVSADGIVRHSSAGLPCSQDEDMAQELDSSVLAFFAGLNETWPSPSNVVRLESGHPLLAEPRYGFQRPTCVVCGHTFRLHDHVVICPCSPDQPTCQTAIHRDPVHRLHCLEAWNPGANSQRYCPVTSRKIDE